MTLEDIHNLESRCSCWKRYVFLYLFCRSFSEGPSPPKCKKTPPKHQRGVVGSLFSLHWFYNLTSHPPPKTSQSPYQSTYPNFNQIPSTQANYNHSQPDSLPDPGRQGHFHRRSMTMAVAPPPVLQMAAQPVSASWGGLRDRRWRWFGSMGNFIPP